MSIDKKILSADPYYGYYHDTDSVYSESLKRAYKSLEDYEKNMTKQIMNSIYGLIVNVSELKPAQREEFMKAFKKENVMRIKDFIVLHADGQPIMVKKEAIAAISKMSDGTTRVDISNHIWITEDRYDDVIKRLFEV